MKRSFGSPGMGGGGGNNMLRTVGRVIARATVTPTENSSTASRPTHKSSSSHLLSLSSASSSHPPSSPHYPYLAPISATSTPPTTPPPCPAFASPSYCDEFEWVSVDGSSEGELPSRCRDDFVFGSAPSEEEVRNALSDMQQALYPCLDSQIIKDKFVYKSDKDVTDTISSPTGGLIRQASLSSESDWLEPSLQLCDPMVLQTYGSNRVYDAFHLMQTDASIQRMVIGISSDNAVWDAVLNNEVVRELKELFYAAENDSHPGAAESFDDNNSSILKGTSEDSNAATSVMKWIFDGTKEKVMELVDKVISLMNGLFQVHNNSKCEEAKMEATPDPFMQKLTSSFTISIVVLLIVVLTRTHRT